MPTTPMARRGMVSSPHHLASQAGLAVLRDGGNAIEAAIAAAAVLSAVLPHKGGLGGDGFWLIAEPGKPPISIDGSGTSGAKVDTDMYRRDRHKTIPLRGGLAAITVPGAISGWQLALDVSEQWGGGIPLERLFEDAVHYARTGSAVSQEQDDITRRHLAALRRSTGFGTLFLSKNKSPACGSMQQNPALADTLEHLATAGLDDFYRGDVARTLAQDLRAADSPILAEDLARHRGMRRRPLSLAVNAGTCFSSAPPTQGLATLITLGVMQRLAVEHADDGTWIAALTAAAAQAGRVRDSHLTDPNRMSVHATTYLTDPMLDRMAQNIQSKAPLPVANPSLDSDGAWLGVIDGQGRAVSYGHSLGSAFGSGIVSPGTGIVLSNQGAGFSLDCDQRNALEPRRKPVHSLSPALARLKDGRVMVWGCGVGETQPLLMGQVFSRMIQFGQSAQTAISGGRFVVSAAAVQLEPTFAAAVYDELTAAGHSVTPQTDPLSLGQVGVLCRRPDGTIDGAADPRGDGSVAAW